ncbi:hypothetical protein PHYSODRAFT_566345 [Phytophthora sojae]|uniref:Uncharacterized protein n=1 Tax=Phytophthora sojae (strain P6497) TaxID=1094619 RepID=G5AF44_PHYSP|nr:hypothetical protein PHYSODRAFT_566345 [Phytophthora sojae]EGZ05834.1 hypothetical protein PHYSODRAFT_566345 [Phytophthora sojae]|eukprot:XP_009538695.1 hypothetical protein PHYSODRAFT_566345 [Phytophthora sojae]
MRVLRPTRLALQRLRAHSARQQRVQLIARAFSDAADPAKRALDPSAAAPSSAAVPDASAPHVNGFVNGSRTGHDDLKLQSESVQFLASYQDDEQRQQQDVEFTAQRIGFPISEAELKERAEYENLHEHREVDGIREETRAEAEAKAERIMAVLRHSMSELEIGKVIHRIAQYATLPRVTGLSRKQFLRSLETRFGENNKKEFGYMLAFLQGRDEVIEQLEIDSRQGGAEADSIDVPLGEPDAQVAETSDDFVVPKIMGLHPDLVADPQFVSIVFCYCRLACLNSLKLMQRPAAGLNRGSKSSLWQVKADFRKVLDMEGYSHYADMLGLEKPAKDEDDEDMDAVDAEWEEFNLENDRIDFRMLLSQTQGIVDFMKTELSNETISKMLVAMLASVKTSKLHRKIFQEMVCNIQTAFPETYHEQLLSELVPFLSGDNATYEDFDSEVATTALQHHQMRNEAIIRALLETRMRVGHILINDIDETELDQSISKKLTPEQHEKVITTAWNIVSVLDDRKYHMFFTRFLKYKLAWRPNRATFGDTFLSDVRKTLGPRDAETIMPMFEEVFQQLSVETLTICRVKLRHSRKMLRGRGALEPLNDAGRERLETVWQPSRCAFFRNLPHGVTPKHLEKALAHIGGVKRFILFANPLNGPPDSLDENSDDEDDDDDEEDEDEEGGEGDGEDKPKKKKKKKKAKAKSKLSKAKAKDMTMFRKPKKKDTIIASDKKTPYQAVVEFDSEGACRKANMRALQIFGVMMMGYKEYRPVFPTPADDRAGLTLMNVPYGTKVGDLVDEVNQVLAEAGLTMKVSGLVPRGVMLTNGRLDLRFPSFVEAAQVAELLHDYVYPMKCRRPLSKRDEERFADFVKYQNTLKSEAGKEQEKKEQEEESEEPVAQEDEAADQNEEETIVFGVPDEEDEEEDDDIDDEDEDADEEDEVYVKKTSKDVHVVTEALEEYFKAWRESEENLTEEQKALGEKLRPFDVTWTPLPKPRNKHMYL